MFKKVNWIATLSAGLIGALAFSIPMFIFVRFSNYRQSWLLYLGSFLFMIVMWIHTTRESKKKANNENTVALTFASHMATIAGVIISFLISLLVLWIFAPGFFANHEAANLENAPANIGATKNDGLGLTVFLTATVVNFSVGSFVGIILPFYLKRNQTRDNKAPTPLHERGTQ